MKTLKKITKRSIAHDVALFKKDFDFRPFRKNWAFEDAQLEIEEIVASMRARFISTFEAAVRVSDIIYKRDFHEIHRLKLQIIFLKATSNVEYDYFGCIKRSDHKGPCFSPPWYIQKVRCGKKPVERCPIESGS